MNCGYRTWVALGEDESLEKTVMLGKAEDRRKKGRSSLRWIDLIKDAMDPQFAYMTKVGHSEGH